ncbi:DUF6301 family protein [Nocardia takedensis]
MQVDIDGAVRVARLAAAFDWTWARPDVVRFCATAGWRIESDRPMEAEFVTDLAVRPAIGFVAIDAGQHELRQVGQEIQRWMVRVSDVDTSPSAQVEIDRLFDAARTRMIAEFGVPTRTWDSRSEIGWELPGVWLRLSSVGFAVAVNIVNPTYQAWLDEPEFDSDVD